MTHHFGIGGLVLILLCVCGLMVAEPLNGENIESIDANGEVTTTNVGELLTFAFGIILFVGVLLIAIDVITFDVNVITHWNDIPRIETDPLYTNTYDTLDYRLDAIKRFK